MILRRFSARLTFAASFASLLVACPAVQVQAQSFGPESFLSRMDQNSNGVLEPSEVSDRMRGFLERIAQGDRSINLSQPIPISRLTQAMERARQERERSGGSSWGGGDRGRDDDRDRDRGRDSRGGSNVEAPAPLVPGFATPELPPVLGFGEDASSFLKVTDEDRREATERMGRYDRNRDGFLDQREMSSGRWSGTPFEYDKNRDGKLSREELALRYAERREEEERERSERNSSSSRGSSSTSSRGFGPSSRGGSSGSSSGIDPRMEGIVNSMLGRYDKNRNGMLDRDEWGEMRSDPSGGDKNRDGRITKEELAAWFSERFQGGGFGGGDRGGDRNRGDRDGGDRSRFSGGFGGAPFGAGGFGGAPFGGGFGGAPFGGQPGEAGGPPNFYSQRGGWGDRGEDRGGDRDSSRSQPSSRSGSRSEGNSGSTADNQTYRFQSTLDRINEEFDLPDDFHRSDVNGDGQIAMSEYASEWPESKVKEFLTLDKNGDGVVTAAEYAAAQESGFKPGSSPSTPSSTTASASIGSNGSTATGGYTEATGSSATTSTSAADRYLGYAKGVVAKYDTNKNGVLDKDEASQVSVVKPETDANGDGQVSAEELAASLSKR